MDTKSKHKNIRCHVACTATYSFHVLFVLIVLIKIISLRPHQLNIFIVNKHVILIILFFLSFALHQSLRHSYRKSSSMWQIFLNVLIHLFLLLFHQLSLFYFWSCLPITSSSHRLFCLINKILCSWIIIARFFTSLRFF